VSTPPPIAAPRSESELLARARELAGLTLAALAARHGARAPTSLRRAKGWTGEVIERSLGAGGASRPEPDFPALGVELKTIPVDPAGRPHESTWVCTVPLAGPEGTTWAQSLVRAKLARVLWVPIVSERGTPPAERLIGTPLLWSPSEREHAALRADFEELMDLVCLGGLDRISARHGTWLQIRPKAAHSRARRRGIGAGGEPTMTLPLGFYLRAAFTARVLRGHYAIGPGGRGTPAAAP